MTWLQHHELFHQFAINIICRKARDLVKDGRVPNRDFADLRQDLILAVFPRLAWFDPSKGDPAPFCLVVVDHCVSALLKARFAQKRGHGRVVPLPTDVDFSSAAADSRCATNHRDLRSDLADVKERLPPHQRRLVDLLQEMPAAEAARKLGIQPSTLKDEIKRIRKRFEAAGLADYLEKSPSSCSAKEYLKDIQTSP